MMNRTTLKICGITQLEDARFCAAAGADLLGFIQHRTSPRYVEPDRIREITEWLHGARTVGVFVDEDARIVNDIASRCGFALLQLHGNETPAYCAEMDTPIIKAIRIQPGTTSTEIAERVQAYAGVVEYILFDTHASNAHGGTGQTFEWSVLTDVEFDVPFFLAGGITSKNVAGAVESVKPFGIDVSSSVEVEPGIKDFDLLREFFESFDQAHAH